MPLVIPPPPPPPPAAVAKGGPSQNAAVNALLAKFPGYRPYLTTILQAAQDNKLDPAILLSFLAFENTSANPHAVSSSGARGLAQIADTGAAARNAAGVPFFRSSTRISDADKADPEFSIRYMAWRVGGLIRSGRSIHDAYAGPGGYNPGFAGDSRGADPGALLTKNAPNYVPAVSASPPAKGAEAATTAAATKRFTKLETDFWVTRKRDGTVGFAKSLNPPKDVVLYQGQPLLRSQLQQVRQAQGGYADTYFTYTGKQPTDAQLVGFMEHGVSIMGLSYQLAAQPSFRQSPLWKSHAPGIVDYARSQGLIGNDETLPQEFVAKALVENWDQSTLQANLKDRPEYLRSPAFQDSHAKLLNVYESIMGPLTPQARSLVNRAAERGETQDVFSAELRQGGGYGGSAERGNQRAMLQAAYEREMGHPPDKTGQALIQKAAANFWTADRLVAEIHSNPKLYAATGQPGNVRAELGAAYETTAGGPPNAAGRRLIDRAVKGNWSPNRLQVALLNEPKVYAATPAAQNQRADLRAAYENAAGGAPGKAGQALINRAIRERWSTTRIANVVNDNPNVYQAAGKGAKAGNTRADLVAAYAGVYGVQPDQKGMALVDTAFRQKWSPQRLQNYIRSQPGLYKQTNEYQSTIAGLTDTYTKLFGLPPDDKGQKMIDRAAHKGWSPQQFVNSIRQNPIYLTSQPFKQGVASLSSQFESIYGHPDSQALLTIREAALQDWTPDQFAAFLRAQPAYTSSSEYQARSLAFLDAMGLITGGQAVLHPGEAPPNTAPHVAAPHRSALLEPARGPASLAGGPSSSTAAGVNRPNDLVAGYGNA